MRPHASHCGLQELFPLLFSNGSFLASGSLLACMFISTQLKTPGGILVALWRFLSLWAAFFPPVLCPWNSSHFGLLTVLSSSQGNCTAVRWDSWRAQLVSSAMRYDYPVVLIFFFWSFFFFFFRWEGNSIPCYSILATCRN